MIDDIKKLVSIPGYANMQRHLKAKRGMKKRKKKMIRLMVYHTIAQTATSETRARYFLLKESRLFFLLRNEKAFLHSRNQHQRHLSLPKINFRRNRFPIVGKNVYSARFLVTFIPHVRRS